MKIVRVMLAVLCGTALSLAVGCGGGASEDKPLDQVTAEAEKMSAEQLRSKVQQYIDAVEKRIGDLKSVQDDYAEIKPTELMSQKAKDLQEKVSEINTSVAVAVASPPPQPHWQVAPLNCS